jgi:hypothetical protein
MTKEERKEYMKLYFQKNKENLIEKRKEYYQNNKDKFLKSIKKYYENNKEKIKEYQKEYNKEYTKEYREKNKEKISNQRKEYYQNNKEKYYDKNKQWRENNKEKISLKAKEYYQKNKKPKIIPKGRNYKKEYQTRIKNPINIIKNNIRCLIIQTFRNNGYSKNTKTYNILGCSFEEFKSHLESQFESWMNWDNYGKYNGELNYGWDIDHYIPVSSATSEEEIIKLNHYTNLQPLCSKINRHIKKDKLDFIK